MAKYHATKTNQGVKVNFTLVKNLTVANWAVTAYTVDEKE